tara:strand:+ start:6456 stop:7157 length:702 start_codon:yes stop_codon:yes gene_type:complete
MAAFSSFSNRLPDPNYSIEETGKGGSGTAGPGFASVQFTSNQPVAISRTNSGRVTTRAIAGHNWRIAITYNPMTRDEFEPVYAFLQERRGRLKPFEIVLPQYNTPRSTVTSTIAVDGAITAGATNFMVDGVSSGSLRPGDMFNFTDSSNSNHKKVYQVTRVLTSTDYLTGNQPTDSSHRVYYVTPSIEKSVSNDSTLDYTPTFRVILTSDVMEYRLQTNNLYQFSLNLEEAQP